ncbi:MAG: orotate phosphoribosyltransferase [Bauldia sp.]|nr:orotate phosphoribosyltransferase [Bauldia sp.]
MSASRAMETGAETVSIPRDVRWDRLRSIIAEHSLMRGTFTLSSGRTSNYLFQLRQTTMHPEGAWLIGMIIEEFMARSGLRTVGGLVTGAVPVVCAVSFASHLTGRAVDAFFLRKDPKPHGARELIDGAVTDGADVLLVDDVATSGGSFVKALTNLHSERPNCTVGTALCVVDREEGAEQFLQDRGIALVSIFKRSDFGI